jgi:hypothetical protein
MPPRTPQKSPDTSVSAALGEQLRLCRLAAGFTSQPALGAKIGTHETVIAKAETGERPPTEDVYGTWTDTCGVTGQLRSALDSLWRLARSKDGPVKVWVAPWFETEAKAHSLRYWSPVIVPGIVQTTDYARALFSAMGLDDEKISEFIEVRMGRQAILNRPDPPDVTMVLWEPVLRNLIGSPEVMRDQLARLLDLSRGPHVHIHVLPSGIGANAGLGGAINLAATDAFEHLLSDGLVEDVVTAEIGLVRRASSTFNDVRSDALPRVQSRAVMTEAMEAWSN